jgi:drug/metabolite transporter (DMT)-like permease
VFGVGRIFLILGYELAGAINGSLAQKSRIILALLFGFIILKEKITKKQIFFSIILFIGLFIAVSQFSFDFFNLNNEIIMGVLILLLLGIIWTLAHTQTKREIFDKKEATPLFIVFIRSSLGGIILISTYFLFFPLENVRLFYEPINLFYFVAIGLIHGIGLFCWYKTISNIDYSKGTILVAPTPIITAVLAYFFLGEIFTIYHLIGTIIIVMSIIVIVREKPIRIE